MCDHQLGGHQMDELTSVVESIQYEVEELELVQLSTGEVVHYEVINNQLMEEVENGNN
jgi:hypothetical protein